MINVNYLKSLLQNWIKSTQRKVSQSLEDAVTANYSMHLKHKERVSLSTDIQDIIQVIIAHLI